MISDSVPWKQELIKVAARLEKKTTQKRWTERSDFLVERDIMIGAYTIRKLIEAPAKLSDPVKQLHVPILSFPLKADTAPPDWWSAYRWWEHYSLEVPSKAQINLRTFCNHVVHSFVFAFHLTDQGEGLAGVFLNSEFESQKALTFIGTGTLIELFRAVGNDGVYSMQMSRDKNGKMQVIKAEGPPVAFSPAVQIPF
ncbi:hypothetical protein [Paeniglutamicibacter psychrophenolicus]|uniref:hypothetical protein n=1 Tax=Paeniglutamicibacter psychrophenolicus TaxID=257454 RepID=UPI0027802A07|nr:hypothetical protein [Paeniglutamicibacter psychrophenolicus]MDQ0095017.1 hypothetical protein [Paeniglutamicibacter psychrophenolicus]